MFPSQTPLCRLCHPTDRLIEWTAFISKKPFYVADDGATASDPTSASDYLEHQRLQKSQASPTGKEEWYERGKKLGPAATKFRKGACENCGSITHKTKECLSRPRKQGAKWTGRDISADDVIQDVNLSWDAKRDRWNGYDAKEYEKVIEEYNAMEDLKRLAKRELRTDHEKSVNEREDDAEDGAGETAADDGVRYEEETDMGRQQSTSTRNLRIREDTAKYLINLDLDSAKYDPKTRSMVDAGLNSDVASALVAEEGFMKASGDAGEFEKAQRYAWETQERGNKEKLHLQANPTSGEYLRRKELEESEARREHRKNQLLHIYGDQEHLGKNQLRVAAVTESAQFLEYDGKGSIRGAHRVPAKSQYPEDVIINNHTAVWGSWWHNFRWGYACCHSTLKNSYCTGQDGIRLMNETNLLRHTGEKTPECMGKSPVQTAYLERAISQDSSLNSEVRKRSREQVA